MMRSSATGTLAFSSIGARGSRLRMASKTTADVPPWKERSPVARVRALRDAGDATGFSRELWREMAGLGWVGIPFPEDVGGAGMGLAELAVVLEQLGRALAPEPFLSTVCLGGGALLRAGSAAQQQEWLNVGAQIRTRLVGQIADQALVDRVAAFGR